jgi:F-type H+-transporting ATPase subunit alpha
MRSGQSYKNEYEKYLNEIKETGFVERIIPPLVYVNGLPGARLDEVVYFESGEMGIVRSLEEEETEVLVFSNKPVRVGSQVARSGNILMIPVGDDFLGQSVDPLGNSLNPARASPAGSELRSVDEQAPGIGVRERVVEPFITGVTVVDLMIPLGKGQRELVLGDRKTGKTEFLLQTMLSQAREGAVCIYAGVGRKKADIKKIEDFIAESGIQQSTIVISSSSTDPLGLIYITPYCAMTLSEYFKDTGRNVVLILDDMSTHAKFYREISLVGRRFPGRNSYPGDIFYTHARLLERAGNFQTQYGVCSLTCLPVVETIESDISGYIQTNLMSITDGHVYFDTELFEQGRRPSVNYFLSVTRVGRQTQSKLHWGVNRELSSFLTLLEKTKRYIHFGAEINEGIRSTLAMGDRIMTLFNQPMGKIFPINLQMFLFSLIWAGLLGDISPTELTKVMDNSLKSYMLEDDFRQLVDKLIEENEDFNVLLGKISSQSKSFMDKIKE